MQTAAIWLIFNLFSVMVLAFYSMLEMACISFNKVRLQYYVMKGKKRAIWLSELMQNPSNLFGTTLIGVNVATFVGSECAREFHAAIGVNPDWAPISQVVLVIIFGELAPMFAARHYAEHVAMLGAPLIYFSSKVMAPILWVLEYINKIGDWIVGSKQDHSEVYLNQDELKKMIGAEDDGERSEQDDVSLIAANIFHLKEKIAKDIMTPIDKVFALPSDATVTQMRNSLNRNRSIHVLVYHKNIRNIVGIALPRDVIRASGNRRVRDFARSPWFVTEKTSVLQLIKQFRTNNQNAAIVINELGQAQGIITLDDLFKYVFEVKVSKESRPKKMIIVDKTIPGSMTVEEFEEEFGVQLAEDEFLTVSEVLEKELERHPSVGESVYIAPYEFTVKETALLDVKTIRVTNRPRKTFI